MLDRKFSVEMKTVSSMLKVMPDAISFDSECVGTALLNEEYNFQLAIKNLVFDDEKFFSLEVNGELKDKISIRVVDLVPVTTVVTENTDDYYLSNNLGVYPDVLRSFNGLDLVLKKNRWKTVWISVDISKDVRPDTYITEFILKDACGNEISSVNYNLTVFGVELVETDLKLTNWMHYDCIANYHNVEVFSEKFYKIFSAYLKAYVEIGNNMLYVPLFTPPLDTKVGGERKTVQLVDVKVENGRYSFNFEKLEKFLDFIFSYEIKYVEFSHLFTQWGGKSCPKILADVDGKLEKVFGWEDDSCGERYSKFLNSFLPQLVQFIKKKNIENICYFHITDEPDDTALETYTKCKTLVKKHIGNLKTIDALSHFSFCEKGLVDVAVPITSSFVDFQNCGIDELFVYYCCVPVGSYFSNRFINMPSQRTRILGFQLYEIGVQGFLHWGYNFYNSAFSCTSVNPYACTDAGGLFPSGDSFIVYPNDDGSVNKSIRAESLREGFNDYRALKTLEKFIGREKVLEILRKYVVGLKIYPKSANWHKNFRDEINRLISTYSKNVLK